MKKILMTLGAAMVAVCMNAQVYLGGNVAFVSNSHDGNSETNFAILPEIGYNLGDDMSLGMVFGYGENGKDASKVKTVTVNPYLRYNVVKFDKVNLFIDGGFDFTNNKYNTYKNNEWGIGLKPGVAVNLNSKLSFVAHVGFLGYVNSKDDYDGAKAKNTFGFSLDGSDLNFGLYYNF